MYILNRKSAYDVFAPSLMQQITQNQALPTSRRSSFRGPPPDEMNQDTSPTSELESPVLTVENTMPLRRRGSQL